MYLLLQPNRYIDLKEYINNKSLDRIRELYFVNDLPYIPAIKEALNSNKVQTLSLENGYLSEIAKTIFSLYPAQRDNGTRLKTNIYDVQNRLNTFKRIYKQPIDKDVVITQMKKYMEANRGEGYKYLKTLGNYIYDKDKNETFLLMSEETEKELENKILGRKKL